VGPFCTPVSNGRKVKGAANAAEAAIDGTKAVGKAVPAPSKPFKWKPGDDVRAPTRVSDTPSASTIRRREWMNEAQNPTRSDYTPEDFLRMRKGQPPRRYNPDKGGMESMERSHHPVPKRDGGTETIPQWPQEHAAIDPYRRPGY
jgi:filamentous hemagglutinin